MIIARPVSCFSPADFPANTRRSANVGTMLGQRRRRWSNIVPTLAERLVFAGLLLRFLHVWDLKAQLNKARPQQEYELQLPPN